MDRARHRGARTRHAQRADGRQRRGLGGIAAIVVDAASYLLSAAFLRRLPEPPPLAAASDAPPAPRTVAEAARGLARQTRTGLRAIADDATLRALALLITLISFAGGLGATSYMIYVTRDLAFSTGVLGMIFAVGGVGSVGGAWLATRLDARVGAPRALFAGLVLGTLGAIAAPLATGATLVGVLLLCAQQIVGDAGLTVYQVHDRTLRQARAPAAALARVDAGLRTLGHLGTLAGALVGGIAAEALGARAMLFAMAAIYACAAIGAWLWLPRRAPAVA